VRVRVNFRVNTQTGEIEVFQVDDLGARRMDVDHDATHEEIAHRIGALIELRPIVDELIPGSTADQPMWELQDESEATQASRQELESGE